MADMTTDIELDVDEPELSEYTTESQTTPAGAPVRKPTASAPGGATGRRKQAIARVRIVPGTGEWTINGRTLDSYFPNKVHQQLVNEPLKILELDGAYDVLVRVHGGGPSGQAGAVRLAVRGVLADLPTWSTVLVACSGAVSYTHLTLPTSDLV